MQRTLRTLLLAAVLLSSCSVKEDRSDCPCRLEVDLSAFAALGGGEDYLVSSDRIPQVIGSRTGSLWCSDVRKGTYTVSVVRPGAGTQVGTGRVVIPEGSEPDSLYAYAETVDCFGERAFVTTKTWKQFCSVTLRETEPTGLAYGVRSGFGAFSRADLSPLPSLLSFPVRRDADGALRFRLPRQGAGSRLRLTARETDGLPWELPLGEWMDKAGYDWSLPSLEDFSLEIDYAASEVRIRVLDWESGDALTLKI
jgi:hypothetical protein